MVPPRRSSRPRPTFLGTLSVFGLLTFIPGPAAAFAQQNPAPPPAPQATQTPLTMKETLDRFLGYNPAERGPLVMLLDRTATFKPEPRQPPRLSVTTAARLFQRKVVTVGGAVALVPEEMTVLETNPGRPNFYEGLETSEKIKLLFGSLTEEQWKLLGSERGLGLSDLPRDLRPLLQSILPPKVIVNTLKVSAVEENPKDLLYNSAGVPPVEADPATVRLRAERGVIFMFPAQLAGGGNFWTGDGGIRDMPGDTVLSVADVSTASDPDRDATAFGVPLLKKLPSRQKFSQLPYNTPALDVMVALTPEMKTLGDALKAAGAVTRLELIADARVRDLPLYSRGSRVRAGDLLGALAWGVTGTYRRLGERTFFLTDDVEGMGPRYLRLREWEQTAIRDRAELLAKLAKKAAALQPLRYLSYRRDDPTVPPPEIGAQMEQDLSSRSRPNPSKAIRISDLPPALQAQVRHRASLQSLAPGMAIVPDKVQFGILLRFALVIPGVGTVLDRNLSHSVPTNFIESIVPEVKNEGETTAAAGAAAASIAPAAPVFPATLKRRVLIAALPEETGSAAAAALLHTARERGFSEVWFRAATLDKPEETARLLTGAVTAGKAEKIPVGAVLPLLRYNSAGEDERNIFGETGQQAEERYLKSPSSPEYYVRSKHTRLFADLLSGWKTIEDPAVLVRQVRAALAPVISAGGGLSAVVLTHTGAAGYTGKNQHGPVYFPEGQMGYTPSNRLAFVRQWGYDPLDIPHDQQSGGLRVSRELPFFTTRAFESRLISDPLQPGNIREDPAFVTPVRQWNTFRAARNSALLQPVFKMLSSLLPATSPLYLNDRSSDFTTPNYSWFGTWEQAETLPVNPFYNDEGLALKAAKAASKTILLNHKPLRGSREAGRDFASETVREAGRAAKSWNGLAVDLSGFSLKETREMLRTLPPQE